MKTYDTLTEAIDGLRQIGYTVDFNLKPDSIHSESLDLQLHPDHFHVDEVHRFEGASDPDDNVILYAISSDEGLKGIMVNAYGVYANTATDALNKKLDIKRDE